MVNGDLTTEFDPSSGRILGAAVNREKAAIRANRTLRCNRSGFLWRKSLPGSTRMVWTKALHPGGNPFPGIIS